MHDVIGRSSVRGLSLAAVASVGVVFALAYVDSRREEARSLDEFSGEQAALARTLAAAASGTTEAGRRETLARLFAAARTDGRLVVLDGGPTSAPTPEIAQMMAAMARGEAGTIFLPRPSADALGLGQRSAVAGYAPILAGDSRWSVAVVASARRVRDRARLAAWRLAAATFLTALLVSLFGVAVRRQERRAQRLAAALDLARSLQRAEKLATIGTLSAGIAHEVGTPLGIISGRAEQLLTRVPEGEAGEPMKKGLASILGQVDKVSTTIRQLLDFARMRPVSVEAVAPATAIGGAVSLLEHRFRQAKVSVATEAPPSLAPMAADRGQLEQVLVNLLMNACDACAAGGHVTARARRAADSDGGGVLLEVLDDGGGIAPEHLPSVLDPFFTTKKRGQGTGLGLTIAADIVKNHGGTLAIDSAPGRGTTVRVTWPTAPLPGAVT